MREKDEQAPWVVVYRSRQPGRCEEGRLVLDALEIDYRLDHDGEAQTLLVAPRDASRAAAELAHYDAENAGWPPREGASPTVASGVSGALGYAAVLLAVFGLAQHGAFALDWWTAGAMQASLVREGEWWRAVTALSLHTDVLHLGGNLVFGSLFAAFLSQQLGTGGAWCGMLLAGALGNLANALIQPLHHVSVGASTAVFGAIGIAMVLQWRRRGIAAPSRLRRWLPLIVGVILLVYLGTSGTRTDVLAHITGLASGALLGLLGGSLTRPRDFAVQLRIVVLGMAPLLLTLSWAVALTRSW